MLFDKYRRYLADSGPAKAILFSTKDWRWSQFFFAKDRETDVL
jgi:hypothetical protein